jgi:hypothetical protein
MPPERTFTHSQPHYDVDAALVELAVKEGRIRQADVDQQRRVAGGIWDRILGRFVRTEARK